MADDISQAQQVFADGTNGYIVEEGNGLMHLVVRSRDMNDGEVSNEDSIAIQQAGFKALEAAGIEVQSSYDNPLIFVKDESVYMPGEPINEHGVGKPHRQGNIDYVSSGTIEHFRREDAALLARTPEGDAYDQALAEAAGRRGYYQERVIDFVLPIPAGKSVEEFASEVAGTYEGIKLTGAAKSAAIADFDTSTTAGPKTSAASIPT